MITLDPARQTAGRKLEDAHGGGTGKIVLFMGTTPNIGTTVIAMGAASRLAEWSETTVGYMCLNLKSSKLHRYLGVEPSAGLDSVRAEMRAGSLYSRKLMSYFEPMKESRRLDVLYGATQREQAEFYQPADIRHLLKAARSSYRLTVVEVSAYWDNAATITAAMEADCRVAVTTPDLGHFQEDLNRGIRTAGPLFGVVPEEFLLAVTQYQPGRPGGIRLSDIKKEAGMELAAAVAYDPSLRDRLNEGRLWEYATANKAFAQSLQPLAETIADRLGMGLHSGSSRAPGRVKSWVPLFQGR